MVISGFLGGGVGFGDRLLMMERRKGWRRGFGNGGELMGGMMRMGNEKFMGWGVLKYICHRRGGKEMVFLGRCWVGLVRAFWV